MMSTIILDFDGVIHSYVSGWKGPTIIPDPPVSGSKRAIEQLRMDYEVIVVSTRCGQEGGIDAIKRWLDQHGILVDGVQAHKPPAILTIDDRAIQFKGDWPAALEALTTFQHWHRKTEEI